MEEVHSAEIVSMFHLGPMHHCSVSDQPISNLEDLQTRRVWALYGAIARTPQAACAETGGTNNQDAASSSFQSQMSFQQ